MSLLWVLWVLWALLAWCRSWSIGAEGLLGTSSTLLLLLLLLLLVWVLLLLSRSWAAVRVAT